MKSRIISHLFWKIANIFHNISLFFSKSYNKEMAKRAEPWFKANGDKTLRLNYDSDLNENSIIFDLGGYEGQWTSDIFSKYCSNVYIFEPVKEYSTNILNRFKNNNKIIVLNYGLGAENGELMISNNSDGSSIFKGTGTEKIKIRKFDNFIKENGINSIDLLKINIEGAEYDLLDAIIESGYINKIKNIQVQFHDFIEDSKNRMNKIQRKLKETHYTTYSYEFMWENWRLKDN